MLRLSVLILIFEKSPQIIETHFIHLKYTELLTFINYSDKFIYR